MFRWLFGKREKTRTVEELGVKIKIHVYDSNEELVKGLQGFELFYCISFIVLFN